MCAKRRTTFTSARRGGHSNNRQAKRKGGQLEASQPGIRVHPLQTVLAALRQREKVVGVLPSSRFPTTSFHKPPLCILTHRFEQSIAHAARLRLRRHRVLAQVEPGERAF
jgi:hypothetical protein